MLQTNSTYTDEIQLTAFPRQIEDNVTIVQFETSTNFTGQLQRFNQTIRFVNYNGTQYGVGTVGKLK